MRAPAKTDRALRMAPPEWLFLAAMVLAGALGKDTSWDFRNYHWYLPYAFINDRLNIDIAVAHQASYYNPFLDIPFYLLASNVTSWLALGVQGAVQSLNAIPLYLMARTTLIIPERKLAAAMLTILGMTGALTLSLFGTTYYDNVMSVFVLTGLAILVTQRETLSTGPLMRTALLTALAGFLVGSSIGLKLPEAPFAIGFAAALLALGGDPKHQATRILAGALGGLIGVVLFAGYWWYEMYQLTGNPLFPYFNEYFASPLALASPYRDMRFIPHGILNTLTFPVVFSLNWAAADDIPFQDIRVGVAYLSAIAAGIAILVRGRCRDPLAAPDAALPLFAFAGASLLVWTAIFAIYRYILALEMLAPLLIVTAIGLMPLLRRTQFVAIGGILFVVVLITHSSFLVKAPLGDPYIDFTPPKIAHPDKSLILLSGLDPMGYMAPSLPPKIVLLRIDGWMMQPQDGTKLTAQMRARVNAFKGDLYTLSNPDELDRTHDALKAYGLHIDWVNCQHFDTNLAGPYLFCPLTRIPGMHA